jgi:hypothetical protein
MSAVEQEALSIPFSHRSQKDTRVVKQPSSDSQSEQDNAMGPRTPDDKLDKLMEAMAAQAQATTALVQAMSQKNGKSLTERAGMWMPTILTMLVLGVSTVRFDTTREATTAKDIQVMAATVEALTQRNTELWTLIETQRLRIDKLDKELGIVNDRESRRR